LTSRFINRLRRARCPLFRPHEMTERKPFDWEAIEREYRAGQLTVVEIGRQHGLSHTAIRKRANRDGWTRNLADRVRKEVSARLISDSPEAERAAIEPAVARGVQVVREHRAFIWRGQRLVSALFSELEEASKNRAEIEAAIEEETAADDNGKRRAMMLRAVALPSRAGVIVNLSTALKTLIALERQAFNLGDAPEREAVEVTVAVTNERRKAALALLLARGGND
jgi:hypothetical protein